MPRLRECPRVVLSLLLSVSLIALPAWSSPVATIGTVVAAQRAHVGIANATVGSTVFNGDQVDTEHLGTIQVRAGAARVQLSGSSRVTFATEQGTPTATLTAGTVTFSTANSKAFALHMASAVIRPRGDEPTVGSVSMLNPKELTVRCTRGALTITVEDDAREIPEGVGYHVVLDPDPKALAEAAASQPWDPQQQPKRPGRTRFLWFLIGVVGIGTAIGMYYAWESPDRP